MRRKRNTQGLGLGTTLLVMSLVLTLGFALSSASVSHLHLTTRANNSAQAENLARSVVAIAIAKIFENPDYGSTAPEVLSIPGPVEGSMGQLTFDTAEAARLGIPHSINNLQGANSLPGWGGRVVPAPAVHLVAVGTCRGSTRRLEVVLLDRGFAHAVVSEGPIVSGGGLTITGTDSGTGESGLPADIHTNGDGNKAISLGDSTLITGDAEAVGQVYVDPAAGSVEISGSVLNDQDPYDIQLVNLRSFDPEGLERPYTELSDSYANAPTVMNGILRRDGALSISGDLELDGLLFVDGDFTLQGSLRGEGLLIVTGSSTITGFAALQGENRLAFLSGGTVDLRGRGQAGSILQGLVYTEGGFRARQVTVEGALIAADPDNPGQVDLENSTILHDPKLDLGFTIQPQSELEATVLIGGNRPLTSLGMSAPPSPYEVIFATITIVQRGPDDFEASVAVDPTWHTPFPGSFSGTLAEISDAVTEALSAHFSIPLSGGFPEPDALTWVESEPAEPLVLTIEPSRFTSLADRARIVLWRDF